MSRPKIDLTGRMIGRLTVVREVDRHPNGNRRWECHCSCGNTRIAYQGDLLRVRRENEILSCGCRNKEVLRAHHQQKTPNFGKSTHPVYRTWIAIRARCNNPNTIGYKNYGGRGIRVCDQWENSFIAFLESVGLPPTPKHTLDRIKNDRGYEPGNVRWATRKEQARNRRNNRLIEWKGVTRTLAEWSELLQIDKVTILHRLDLFEWNVERAFTTPPMNKGGRKKKL